MATIIDVARSCGVSPTTVSFVINNGPRPVNARTRIRVLEAIDRLGYRPSAVARGLARQRMETIGVLFSGHNPRIVHNPYAVALLDGVVAAASNLRYNVTLITRVNEAAETLASAICDGRSDGLLILSPILGSEIEKILAERKLPLVLVGVSATAPDIPWVDIDNVKGARLAARHLLGLGHRNIGLLLGPRHYQHVIEREKAFLDELAEAGVVPPPHHILTCEAYGDGSNSGNERMAAHLLSLPDRPTAVLTTSDSLALTLQKAARSLGLNVPQDVSVTGFDDVPGEDDTRTQITTIRQPLFDMGYAAAERLIGKIEGKEEAETATPAIVFPPELIIRQSTQRVPSSETTPAA